MSDAEFQQLRERWLAGESRESIAKAFGYSVGQLFDRTAEARGRNTSPHPGLATLEKRQGRGGGRRSGSEYAGGSHVTAAEVEQRRDEVFKSWSDEEREARYHAGLLIGEGRPKDFGPRAREDSSHHPDREPGTKGWATEPRRGVVVRYW